MYTGATFYSIGQFCSLQYESLTYLGGWLRVGRLISDRMSYRNQYMCSGKATSKDYSTISNFWKKLGESEICNHLPPQGKLLPLKI